MACPEQRTQAEAEAKKPMHLASPVAALLTLLRATYLFQVMSDKGKLFSSATVAFLSCFKETPSYMLSQKDSSDTFNLQTLV